jgi:hypothetical protein
LNLRKWAHHWLVILGIALIAQFIIIAPTLTPEDFITTAPLMIFLGTEGYAMVLVLSAVGGGLGVLILYYVSHKTLSKIKRKYL